jgi:hypothetical protein
MRKLRNVFLNAHGWLLARTLMRRAARYCPFCGAPSTIEPAEWVLIEANDEEVPCAACFARPRLWVKARPQ